MIDRIEMHPTPRNYMDFDQRSGEDRRKTPTMLDPDVDKRKGDRRKRNIGIAAHDD